MDPHVHLVCWDFDLVDVFQYQIWMEFSLFSLEQQGLQVSVLEEILKKQKYLHVLQTSMIYILQCTVNFIFVQEVLPVQVPFIKKTPNSEIIG